MHPLDPSPYNLITLDSYKLVQFDGRFLFHGATFIEFQFFKQIAIFIFVQLLRVV